MCFSSPSKFMGAMTFGDVIEMASYIVAIRVHDTLDSLFCKLNTVSVRQNGIQDVSRVKQRIQLVFQTHFLRRFNFIFFSSSFQPYFSVRYVINLIYFPLELQHYPFNLTYNAIDKTNEKKSIREAKSDSELCSLIAVTLSLSLPLLNKICCTLMYKRKST